MTSTTITKLGPEDFDIANAYLQYGSVEDTAEQLQVPQHEVVRILQTKEVQNYLNGIYLDQGYRNRDKLGGLLDKLIAHKLEEAEETGVYTKKDIVELMELAHKMRMDEIKATKDEAKGVTTAVQVNNQFGDSNMGKLIERLLT